jgi:hypothetical protein
MLGHVFFGKPASTSSCPSPKAGKSSLAIPARKAVAHRETENHVNSTRAISSPANRLGAALLSMAYVFANWVESSSPTPSREFCASSSAYSAA